MTNLRAANEQLQAEKEKLLAVQQKEKAKVRDEMAGTLKLYR